jgi:hypothetical protein
MPLEVEGRDLEWCIYMQENSKGGSKQSASGREAGSMFFLTPLEGTSHAKTLPSAPVSKPWDNTFLLVELYGLWYFVTAALRK